MRLSIHRVVKDHTILEFESNSQPANDSRHPLTCVVKDHTILEFESNSQRSLSTSDTTTMVVKDHTILEFESNSQHTVSCIIDRLWLSKITQSWNLKAIHNERVANT